MWFNADSEPKYEYGRMNPRPHYCNVDEIRMERLSQMIATKSFTKNYAFCVNAGVNRNSLEHRFAAGIGSNDTKLTDCDSSSGIKWENDACWCIPTHEYYTAADIEVKNGARQVGDVKAYRNMKKITDVDKQSDCPKRGG
jgi:hypothetical protein